jgi:hypothetical protein
LGNKIRNLDFDEIKEYEVWTWWFKLGEWVMESLAIPMIWILWHIFNIKHTLHITAALLHSTAHLPPSEKFRSVRQGAHTAIKHSVFYHR